MNVNNFTTSDVGIAFLESQEGLRLLPYDDGVGNMTVGWGHVILPGEDFHLGITKMQAVALLKRDLRRVEQAVNTLVTVELSQCQFDALVSLVFNIGISAFRESTLLKVLNQHNYGACADWFLHWDHANGKVLPGLYRRRCAEREMFLGLDGQLAPPT